MADPAGDALAEAAASFEPQRRFLVGLAYRMLGSVAEAEDVAQDAFLRWTTADRPSVADPRSFLARTVSRLCLDRMKSASAQRERYVGTWLPEPLLDDVANPPPLEGGPHAAAALTEDVSFALMMTLERLSPLERAAFLLHDVFDMDHGEIAAILDRSEAACRQLAARGRDHVREERPRFETTADATARLAGAFHAAMRSGDLAALAALLAEDVVLYNDGGGKRRAALNPIYGKPKLLRFFAGLARNGLLPAPEQLQPARINGGHGFVISGEDGVEVLVLEVSRGQIVAIYGVRNPDKLRHLGRDAVRAG